MSTSRIDLVHTGIGQLDELLGGGFPKGRCVLVTGGCGTGKSTVGIQFLVEGAIKYGESGILVTTEQSPSAVRSDMKSFGWDLESLEREHKLAIVDVATPKSKVLYAGKDEVTRLINLNTLLLALSEVSKSINAQRVVVDSLPGLELIIQEPAAIRHAIHRLIATLKELGVTSMLISEGSGHGQISRYDVEEFICDGVIFVEQIREKGKFERGLTIVKMRGVSHESKTCPMMITGQGISVVPTKVASMSSALDHQFK
ncbi:MAG: ATPase domain-containing protein [Candidatus Atabeyarchaeum deiterrae]